MPRSQRRATRGLRGQLPAPSRRPRRRFWRGAPPAGVEYPGEVGFRDPAAGVADCDPDMTVVGSFALVRRHRCAGCRVRDELEQARAHPLRRTSDSTHHQPCADHRKQQGNEQCGQDHERVVSREEHQPHIDQHGRCHRNHRQQCGDRELLPQRPVPHKVQQKPTQSTRQRCSWPGSAPMMIMRSVMIDHPHSSARPRVPSGSQSVPLSAPAWDPRDPAPTSP